MGVIIGMDPHKRSATIEVIDERAVVLAAGRYGTDKAGYADMLAAARRFADRVWAVEGCDGIGRNLAHRLVHDGEPVFDVPPKLSAQVRVFATGNGRKTDPAGAHSVALAARRAPGLVQVRVGEDLVVMGMLADRRDELGQARTQVAGRLHRLLLELLPGGARKFLSARQARTLIATVKPRDLAGKTRRRLAAGLISELEAIDKKTRALDKELAGLVTARGAALTDLHGIGPSGAARLLADAADVHRFARRDRFASWNGPVPLDASSGSQSRHRLSRAGNRRINRVLHIMAAGWLRNQTKGRAYCDARRAGGMPSMMAMRALKRRLSNVVFARMLADQKRREASPGGQSGTPADSSVAGPDPRTPALRTSHVPGPPLHSLNGVCASKGSAPSPCAPSPGYPGNPEAIQPPLGETAHWCGAYLPMDPARLGAARVGGEHNGALVFRVSAPAVGGRATEAALTAVVGALGVRRNAVTLIAGASSRTKIVEIEGADCGALNRLLANAGHGDPT